VRSKRAFLARPEVVTPIPTSTPEPCNLVMAVSDEIGGPGKLLTSEVENVQRGKDTNILRLSQVAGNDLGEVRITPTFALARPTY